MPPVSRLLNVLLRSLLRSLRCSLDRLVAPRRHRPQPTLRSGRNPPAAAEPLSPSARARLETELDFRSHVENLQHARRETIRAHQAALKAKRKQHDGDDGPPETPVEPKRRLSTAEPAPGMATFRLVV